MNKFAFVLVVIAIVIIVAAFRKNEKQLVINDHKFTVEIADNIFLKGRGLSGRTSLCKDCGMLFTYSTPGYYGFWMHEMKFNLDFVFIKGDRVVDIAQNIPYPKRGENPAIINAKEKFDKVLEINQGVIEKAGINIGDTVEY